MRIAGIIAEYNPFHNGHALHIQKTRELTECDYLIVVMSGCFTQRGEPAIVDKWLRAQMALTAGADLVIELPALFAMRPADRFASGGVGLLGALSLVDTLSFGCEIADIELLRLMSEVLEAEPEPLKKMIRAHLAAGKSYPRARGEALSEYLEIPVEWINAPNAVLALEYLRCNRHLNRPMKLCVIRRSSDYHSQALGPCASASAVRAALLGGRREDALCALPEYAAQALKDAGEDALARPEEMDNLLLYRLRALESEQIARLPDVSEGLEMRVKKKAALCASRAQLLDALKCKRYTYARLSRILSYALLGIDRTLVEMYPTPPYARVLGFRESARPLLRALGGASMVPLVSSPIQLQNERCFTLERRATDLWGLCTRDARLRQAGRDLTERLLVDYAGMQARD